MSSANERAADGRQTLTHIGIELQASACRHDRRTGGLIACSAGGIANQFQFGSAVAAERVVPAGIDRRVGTCHILGFVRSQPVAAAEHAFQIREHIDVVAGAVGQEQLGQVIDAEGSRGLELREIAGGGGDQRGLRAQDRAGLKA